jgi:hypothetical protein
MRSYFSIVLLIYKRNTVIMICIIVVVCHSICGLHVCTLRKSPIINKSRGFQLNPIFKASAEEAVIENYKPIGLQFVFNICSNRNVMH